MSFFRKTPAYESYRRDRVSPYKKKKYIMAAVIAAVIIVIFAAIFFIIRPGANSGTYYRTMDKASLPTVTCYFNDRLINRMHGYSEEMDRYYMRDTLFILQDRYDMDIHIDKSDFNIRSISYEVMDLPKGNLIQRSDAVSTLKEDENGLRANLQIDNIIDEDREYSLKITLNNGIGENINYYCRIMKSSAPYLEDHAALVERLHKSQYKSDTADAVFGPFKSDGDFLYDTGLSLGRVALTSTISYLSWGEMRVQETVPYTLNLIDYDGELAFFRADYQTGRNLDSSEPQYYNASEYFRTRINETNSYLLDYERNATQIFRPSSDIVYSDHINLGVVNDPDIQSFCSPNGNLTAFVDGGALWMMNTDTKEITRIFDFASDESDVRDIYDQHDINIVDVNDSGDVRFIVYGYMNKGTHEGKSGIGLYSFRFSDLQVTENAFIPSDIPYQLLKYSINDLCYMNTSGTLFIMINNSIYSIDPENNTAVLKVSGLTPGSYRVSEDNRVISWQEDGLVNDAVKIKTLDMETLKTYEITAEAGKCIKVEGFLNNDMVYGQGDAGKIYTDSNGNEYLLMTDLYAVDSSGAVQSSSSENGYYFINAIQEYNRLIAERVVRSGDEYVPAGDFTIFATELNDYPEATIYTATEENRKEVLLLGLPKQSSEAAPLNILTSPKVVFSSEEVSDVNDIASSDWNYLVYGKGRLISPESSAAAAVISAYDNTGCAVNADSSYFYRRGMRASSVEINDEDVRAAAEAYRNETALNITGIGLAQAMSFTSRRIPLIWERGGEGVYVISGYTASDALILYDINSKETSYLSYNEADRTFTEAGRCFVYE